MCPANNRFWIQYPLKKVSETAVSYEIIDRYDENPIGSSSIKIIPSGNTDSLSIVPAVPGKMAFFESGNNDVDFNDLVGLRGMIRLQTDPIILGNFKKALTVSLDPLYIPDYFLYENIELDNLAVDNICGSLETGRFCNNNDEGNKVEVEGLTEKKRLFFTGKIWIDFGKNDTIGIVSKNDTNNDYILKLTCGYSQRLYDGSDIEQEMPLSYFYQTFKDLATTPETTFFINNHEEHSLHNTIIGDPPIKWSLLGISKVSIDETNPVPQKGIDNYQITIKDGDESNNSPIPKSGLIFIRQNGDTLKISVKKNDHEYLPIREKNTKIPLRFQQPFSNELIIEKKDTLLIEHNSLYGTWAVISLGTRKDAKTFYEKLEERGFSPVAPIASGVSPSLDIIKQVLKSSPDWLFLGGHYYPKSDITISSLYNDPILPQNNIELLFKEDKIKIIHPEGNVELEKAGADLKFHLSLKVVIFGGCDLFGEHGTYELNQFTKLMKVSTTENYPIILGWRDTTSWQLLDQFLGGLNKWSSIWGVGDKLLKGEEDFFSRINECFEDNDLSGANFEQKIRDAWFNTAQSHYGLVSTHYHRHRPKIDNRYRPGRAALMDRNGKVWGFELKPGRTERSERDPFKIDEDPIEIRSVE